jgi:hypothetical protein
VAKVEAGDPGVAVRRWRGMLRVLAKRPAGLRICLEATWMAKSMARRLFLMALVVFCLE